MRHLFAAAVAALLVAGCADTSDRISAELVRAGLDAGRADCVGQRLERDLSLNQLRQLANAARAYRTNDSTPGQLTGSDLLRVSAQVQDPAVAIAVARAAGACA